MGGQPACKGCRVRGGAPEIFSVFALKIRLKNAKIPSSQPLAERLRPNPCLGPAAAANHCGPKGDVAGSAAPNWAAILGGENEAKHVHVLQYTAKTYHMLISKAARRAAIFSFFRVSKR